MGKRSGVGTDVLLNKVKGGREGAMWLSWEELCKQENQPQQSPMARVPAGFRGQKRRTVGDENIGKREPYRPL